jgi:hypothetical protein
MDWCDMSGCHDTASNLVRFTNKQETKTLLEVCDTCADWWSEKERNNLTIRRYENKERELAK